jgi:hypothetical protein
MILGMDLQTNMATTRLESAIAQLRLDRVLQEQQRRRTPPSWAVDWSDVPALERIASRDGMPVSARHVLGQGLEVVVEPSAARIRRTSSARD